MKNKKSFLYGIIIIATLLFVIFGEGTPLSYVYGGDTEAYYLNFHHHIGVAPGYPLFIHVIQVLFGDSLYLHVTAVIQIALLVFSIFWLIRTIDKIFQLKVWEVLLVWGFSMLPFVMLLPEDPIGHELMTESLTYPLFYLFIAETAKGIIWKKRKHLVWSFVICALQMWIRPQMLFCFAVLGVSVVYLEISERMKTGKKKGLWKNWAVRCVLCALCIFAGIKAVSGLTVVYERVFFDAPALDYSDQTLVQRLLYLAQEEDQELFADEQIKAIYAETWERMEEKQTVQAYYGNSWKNWSEMFQAFGTNSRILGTVIREELDQEGILAKDEIGQEIQVSDISHEIAQKLLKKYWKEHLALTVQLLPKSFISTVFFHKKQFYDLIWIASCLVYLGAGITGILQLIKRKHMNSAEFMLLVMAASIINALGCDLVLAGLQRYMTYTLGMTWIGLFLLVRPLWDRTNKGNLAEEEKL